MCVFTYWGITACNEESAIAVKDQSLISYHGLFIIIHVLFFIPVLFNFPRAAMLEWFVVERAWSGLWTRDWTLQDHLRMEKERIWNL